MCPYPAAEGNVVGPKTTRFPEMVERSSVNQKFDGKGKPHCVGTSGSHPSATNVCEEHESVTLVSGSEHPANSEPKPINAHEVHVARSCFMQMSLPNIVGGRSSFFDHDRQSRARRC